MNNPSSGKLKGTLLTIAASMLWGTTFIFIGFGLKFTDPYTLVFTRFLLATVAMVPAPMIFKNLHVISELKRPALWMIGLADTMGYLLSFIGQSYSSAAETSLLSNLYPVVIPLLAFLLLSERIGKYQLLSTSLGLVGLTVVMVPNMDFRSIHFVGDIILFLSSLATAIFVVLAKKGKFFSASSIFALMVVNTIFLAVPAILFGHLGSIGHLGGAGWLVLIWLALPCTLVATSLSMSGLKYISASQSGTVLFLELVTGFMLSVAVFGEPHLIVTSIGACIITVSIVISSLVGSTWPKEEKLKHIELPTAIK